MIVVMQRIVPANLIDVFGIFDTKELADAEVQKAIKSIKVAYPNAHEKKDSLGNYTVCFDWLEKEYIQFDFNIVEKNKQLRRAYRGNYDILKNNGWESHGNGVFIWR